MGCWGWGGGGGGGAKQKSIDEKFTWKNMDTAGTSRKKVMQALINIYLIQ